MQRSYDLDKIELFQGILISQSVCRRESHGKSFQHGYNSFGFNFDLNEGVPPTNPCSTSNQWDPSMRPPSPGLTMLMTISVHRSVAPYRNLKSGWPSHQNSEADGMIEPVRKIRQENVEWILMQTKLSQCWLTVNPGVGLVLVFVFSAKPGIFVYHALGNAFMPGLTLVVHDQMTTAVGFTECGRIGKKGGSV